MPIDPSIQRKLDSMKGEMQNLRQANKDAQSAQSDKLKNDLEMLKNKREQILDAEKKRNKAEAQQSEEIEVFDATELVEAMVLGEKAATGGFDYEKTVNDKLKKAGKADKDSTTAGSSADAPDATFNHNGKKHKLEIKQNSKAMYGQIELHHNGTSWDVSERSKKKYPETHKAIAASGFLKKVNKQWDKPTGDYDKDLKMGNVYHDHPDAEPIKAHYGKDRKTDYIQIGGGHGFYHTGNDAAKLGSPELQGKTQFRARMKYRGTDKKTGKKKYGATIVMGLKDADKSHHDLDAPTQKEWINYNLNGPKEFVLESTECMKHGFEAGQTGATLNNPYDKGSKEYAEYQDGYYRGDAQRRLQQTNESHAPVAPSIGVHRIGVTVSDPDHPMVSQRDTKLQKFVRVTHHDANAAIERGKRHYSKKGWKVHDAWHAGNVHESLEEAHKIGDKVEITGGSAKGTKGHIGEIRHGLYKGAPKTITVYHGEKGATQVKQHLVKRINEEVEHLVHVNDGSKYGDQPHDKDVEHVMAGVEKHKGKFAGHTDKGTLFKFDSHDHAKAFKKHVDSCPKHTCDADLTEGLKHHVAAAAIAVAGALSGHAHAQSAPQHDTSKPAATATAQDSDKSPHDGAPKAEHKARIDKAESEGTMTRGDANVERMKHGLRPSFGRVRMNQESVQIDEISQKLAGDYYGAATKKHLAKVGMRANMYDRIEKDMGKQRKAGIDRALDRVTGARKTNEDVEQIDELKNSTLQSYKVKANSSVDQLSAEGKHGKALDRQTNIMKATGKQIDKTSANIGRALRGEPVKEDAAVNNVGDGAIAGTKGDAGKKVVMTKEPLKRKALPAFKTFVSQEHDT